MLFIKAKLIKSAFITQTVSTTGEIPVYVYVYHVFFVGLCRSMQAFDICIYWFPIGFANKIGRCKAIGA